MPIVFVCAVIVYTIVLWVIGLIWLLVLVLPYLIIAAAIAYLIRRKLRRRAELQAQLEREADRQRQLNAQEFAAWQAVVEEGRRKALRREKTLRKFDSTRDPPA